MTAEKRGATPLMGRMSNLVEPHLRTATILLTCLVLISTSVVVAAPGDDRASQRSQLEAASLMLRDHFAEVQARSRMAPGLQERIDGDLGELSSGVRPYWMTDAMFADYEHYTALLDSSLVDQLGTGSYHDVGRVRGMDDVLFRSPADNSMQPMAVYVPASYDPIRAAPLVVFLHGKTWTENDVFATQSIIRDAAERSGAIVVAPYARGDNQYVDPASSDVFAALDVAEHAFNVDCRRIYLAGHSMGGYGVFVVGPKHPERWSALLAVSGAMTNQNQSTALASLTNVPVYLVWGSDDDYAPAGYFQRVVDILKSAGIETHGSEHKGGRHAIVTIRQTFDEAWREMMRRSKPPGRGC